MGDNINALIEILEQQERVYKNILKLSNDKKELIVSGKVSELENLVKLEQAFVIQIGRLEQQRQDIIEKIYEELQLDKNNMSISNFIDHLDTDNKQRLKSLEDRMKKVLDELKTVNELNSKLIKHSLEYIEFSLNVMTGTSVSGNTYEGKGSTKQIKTTKNLFDIKL